MYYYYCFFFFIKLNILTDNVFLTSLRLMSIFLIVIAFIWYQNSKFVENFILSTQLKQYGQLKTTLFIYVNILTMFILIFMIKVLKVLLSNEYLISHAGTLMTFSFVFQANTYNLNLPLCLNYIYYITIYI